MHLFQFDWLLRLISSYYVFLALSKLYCVVNLKQLIIGHKLRPIFSQPDAQKKSENVVTLHVALRRFFSLYLFCTTQEFSVVNLVFLVTSVELDILVGITYGHFIINMMARLSSMPKHYD